MHHSFFKNITAFNTDSSYFSTHRRQRQTNVWTEGKEPLEKLKKKIRIEQKHSLIQLLWSKNR